MAILNLKHYGNAISLTLYDSEAHDGDVYLQYIHREIYNVKLDVFSSVCESYFSPSFYRQLSRILKTIAIVVVTITVVLICFRTVDFIFHALPYMEAAPPPDAPPTGSSVDIFSILLGSGGIIALVQTFLNTRRGEISVKRNDKGLITEINFKGVAHEEVPRLLQEISKSLEKSDSRLINKSNNNHA